jgi:hypothetical protein
MTAKLEELKAACEVADATLEAVDAAWDAAWEAVTRVARDARDAYEAELKKQENSNDH